MRLHPKTCCGKWRLEKVLKTAAHRSGQSMGWADYNQHIVGRDILQDPQVKPFEPYTEDRDHQVPGAAVERG